MFLHVFDEFLRFDALLDGIRMLGAFPPAESPSKCVGVITQAGALGQLLEESGIASAEHYVVGDQSRLQPFRDVRNVLTPALFAVALQATATDEILKGLAVL